MSHDPHAETVLDVTGLRVGYGRARVIDDVTLRLGRGEALGLIGETGSGKTTLARAVVGLVKPRQGRIEVAGEEVTGCGRRQWRDFRRRGVIQYVFQDPLRSLDPDVTIGDSLAEPLLLRAGHDRSGLREKLVADLARVRLDADLLDRFPGELSGGQRQRVLVARALVTDPQVLILDEPVSALDAANRVQVLEILKTIRAEGTSLLFISHDLGSVAGITDRVAVLYRGDVVETADTPDLINRPQHPYTRLLVGSAPTLSGGAIDRAERADLRRLLEVA